MAPTPDKKTCLKRIKITNVFCCSAVLKWLMLLYLSAALGYHLVLLFILFHLVLYCAGATDLHVSGVVLCWSELVVLSHMLLYGRAG